MAVVVIILVAAVVGLIGWWYSEYFRYSKYLEKYPGPPVLPLIGNTNQFKSDDYLGSMQKLHQKYGPIVKLFMGNTPALMCCDLKLTELLLSSPKLIEKSYEYKFVEPWLGKGLLTSTGAKWKTERKLITPTFHFQILEQFLDVFDKEGDVLVKKLEKQVGKEIPDIYPYITLCTLDIICQSSMRTSVNAQNDSDSEYVRSVKDMLRISVERSFSIVQMIDFTYAFTKNYQTEKKALKVIHGFVNSVIKQRREELANTDKNTSKNDDDTGIKKRSAFLDMLLECRINGEPLPDDVIRDEVNTLMFAGHDTTSGGMSFTLYALSNNPDVQQKVYEELKDIFADDPTRPPTYQDLQEMKYLEIVIKESMRRYPVVSAISRVLTEDVEFDGGILPKGLSITVNIHEMHASPKLYPDPEKFDPERFSPKNSVGRPAYGFIPFSAGPRNCLGQKFASLEMKSLLSKLLRNYELLPVPGHKPHLISDSVLRSANGLPIRIKKRNV